MSKHVSLFNMMCMPAIFGAFHTKFYSETDVAFAPTTVNEYAGVQAAVIDRLEESDHTPSGDPF